MLIAKITAAEAKQIANTEKEHHKEELKKVFEQLISKAANRLKA